MSRFSGLLATSLAGGAAVIGKQAGDDIEQQRRNELMQQAAAVEEARQMRLLDMQNRLQKERTLYETSGEGGAARLDFERRAGEQANDLRINGEVARATNPELVAAREAEFDAELQRKIKAGKALLPLEIERASKLAAADAGTRAKYRDKPQTMGEKAAELETFLGRKLDPKERELLSGLARGRDPETGYETVVEKKYDANGNEIGSVTRKVPIRAGAAGPAQEVDELKATMDAARAAREKKETPSKAEKTAEKQDDKPAGRGMLPAFTGGTGRSQANAITEDPPRRGYPGGFIFNGKTYPTLEAAKAARGY
jgi:hypothetical protein